MFNLEDAIAEWRRQMIAGGVKTRDVLDELETHLRDELQAQARAGLNEQQAFAAAIERMGRAGVLQHEFAKVGGFRDLQERLRQAIFTLAGIPDQYAEAAMNTSNTNIEARWATYLKAAVFVAPAILLWAVSMIFIFPKLQAICRDADVALPSIYQLATFVTHNNFLILPGIILALIFLEWRWAQWPRYRRAALGLGVFLLNAAILFLITLMLIVSMIAAPALMHR